jgi:hypothetical protein
VNLATATELVTVGAAVGGTGLWLVRGGHWIGTLKSHLERLDKGQVALEKRLGGIEAQLKPNGGGSLHDQVRAVAEHQRNDEATADLARALALVLTQRKDPPATT